MRQRAYQISTLLSLTAVSFVVIGWITALVRHTEFSRFGTVTGLTLAWLFALCHCLTRPITETIHPPRTRIKPILHRVSFVLGLVCITMIPVGLIIRGTERGDLPEHFYSGYGGWAVHFFLIHYFTQPALDNKKRRPDGNRH